ncbi:MAG: hypothetical protein FJ109_02255 [Deltaproteobacteria bacterium]|nr:hypothetical protein [Deltaproteobacteria bacterium]
MRRTDRTAVAFLSALALLSSMLFVAASCSGGSAGSPPDSTSELPSAMDGQCMDSACGDAVPGTDLPGDVSVDSAGEVGADGMTTADADEADAAAPGCEDPLAGMDLAYAGTDSLEPPDPGIEAFLAEVDDAFALAALSDPPVALSRQDFPVYDFKPEGSPKGRLAWEYRVRHGHFDNPGYLKGLQAQLEQAGGDTAVLLSFLSDKVDAYVEPGSVEPLLARADELAAQPEALSCALLSLSEAAVSLPPEWEALPADMQEQIARFLFAARISRALQEQAMAGCEALIPIDESLYGKALTPTFDALASADGLEACGNQVDFRQLFRGAQVLTSAAETLADQAEGWETESKLVLDTGLGRVVIAPAGKNMHKGKDADYLLILDLGGDDTYLDGLATSRPTLPLAVVIDMAGNDLYTTQGAGPAFAAGFLGYGILLDRSGDDTYSARYDSVAAACLGVAVLKDESGVDFYDSVDGAQASAHLGAALLLDMAGDDHYYAFRMAQGMGAYRGTGLLLDRSGDDFFEAEDDEVIYPAAQNPNYNANMSQGAGFGFRNDVVPFTDTYCGGIGMLADLVGADVYSGGIFSQAVGYWFGVGFLIDSEGDDSYSGVWYNQGAAAHFAGGAHLDSAGNDTYYCVQDQCMGEGRDYSIGTLIELGGNDEYYAKGGRNIGSGDLFGSGVLWDAGGKDSYKDDTPWAIGFVTTDTYVENSFTFGLFLDTGGAPDSYTLPSNHAADSTFWTQLGNGNDGQYENVIAVGRDK